MNVIHDEVRAAEEKELANAVSVHGLHHSRHEQYAVMLEEYEEAVEAGESVKSLLARMWNAVKDDNETIAAEHAARVEHFAICAAEEFIQLAAMAKKGVDAHV